jgi:hypothetical protein
MVRATAIAPEPVNQPLSVADEVRKLAERSGSETKQIAELIRLAAAALTADELRELVKRFQCVATRRWLLCAAQPRRRPPHVTGQVPRGRAQSHAAGPELGLDDGSIGAV